MARTPRSVVERLVDDVTPGTLGGRVQVAQPSRSDLRRPDRGGERTSLALQVVGGRWLFIADTEPTDGRAGDLWVSLAVDERAQLRVHDGTDFVADRRVIVQDTEPTGKQGDLWVSTASGERAKLRVHDGTAFVAD